MQAERLHKPAPEKPPGVHTPAEWLLAGRVSVSLTTSSVYQLRVEVPSDRDDPLDPTPRRGEHTGG